MTINVKVKRRGNESIDSLISKFKRKVNDSGILESYRKKQYFEKPTDKRRRERSLNTFNTNKRLKSIEL